MTEKTVDLVLTHYWYNEILEGRKRIEYRKITDFWKKRILGKTQVRFRKGYSKESMLFRITRLDVGPCPYDGWEGDYFRIYFE